jgi:hypothetical protein
MAQAGMGVEEGNQEATTEPPNILHFLLPSSITSRAKIGHFDASRDSSETRSAGRAAALEAAVVRRSNGRRMLRRARPGPPQCAEACLEFLREPYFLTM